MKLIHFSKVTEERRGKSHNSEPSSPALGYSLSHYTILPLNLGMWKNFGNSVNWEEQFVMTLL